MSPEISALLSTDGWNNATDRGERWWRNVSAVCQKLLHLLKEYGRTDITTTTASDGPADQGRM
jgi:hypothetical protein